MLRTIGLMSGTSLDGVDAALIETDGQTIGDFGRAITLPFAESLRADLRRLLDLAPTLDADDPFLSDVTRRLTAAHVEAVIALGEPADLIGFHGQTILHQPNRRRTWQIGDACALASATKCPVAYDFRTADIASGGQGAPLAPLFHAAIAAGLRQPLAVLNLGGVANVTYLADDVVYAADVGPGNGPLDDWVARHGLGSFDEHGRISSAGRPNEAVIARLMDDPFFSRPWPKSLDRLAFAGRLRASGLDQLDVADGAATLVAFIAAAVASSSIDPRRWLVCGGGRHNPSIIAALRSSLRAPVDPVEAVGWNGDAIEAQCFGYLAARVYHRLPLTLPSTTGAPYPLEGGKIAIPV